MSAPAPERQAAPRERIMSVDALRGFDMLWIIGGADIVKALREIGGGRGALGFLAGQLGHSPWEGFTFYDLVFPLFVFLVGLSVVLSLPRMVERQGSRAAHLRVLRRFALLFVLGIIYNGGLTDRWPDVRLMGVLQRIALCYLFTSLLFLHLRARGLVAAFVGILVGYWALLTFVPSPGQTAVSLAPGRNIVNWVDQHYLPGRSYWGTWDPEGMLSTFPAVATCLLGAFAGLLLTSESIGKPRKALHLIWSGAAMVAVGYLWGLQLPVIKGIWTSSYVLVSGGYSSALLGVFYWVIDLRERRWWAQPFVWVGANALTLYLLSGLVSLDGISRRLVGGSLQQALGRYGDAAIACMSLGLLIALAWFMYRRRVFIRL
ncbi:MAG: acyltransferase family protein [Armatimonadota bacterium]